MDQIKPQVSYVENLPRVGVLLLLLRVFLLHHLFDDNHYNDDNSVVKFSTSSSSASSSSPSTDSQPKCLSHNGHGKRLYDADCISAGIGL